MMAFVGVSCVLASVGGVAWLAWVRVLIPRAERITFFGRRNVYNTGLSLTLSVVAGLIIDGCQRISPDSANGFVVVFAIAMGCGLFGLTILSRIPEPVGSLVAPPDFHRLVFSAFSQRNFRRLTCFYAISNAASQIATPFFTVYMLESLALPFWFVTFVGVLASVAGIGATGFWARMTRRFGTKPVAMTAAIGDALIPLAWMFVDRPWVWVLIPLHLSGVFNAPMTMNRDDLVLKLAPPKNGSPYLAMFNAVVGPSGALGAILGGLLCTQLSTIHWSAGELTFGGLKILFFISFVGRLASVAILQGVNEPDSQPITRIIRVLRRARRQRRFERQRPVPERAAA